MPLDTKRVEQDDNKNVSVEKETFEDDDSDPELDLFFSCSSDEERPPVQPSAVATSTATDMIIMKTETTKDKLMNIMKTNKDTDTDTDIEEEEEHTLTGFGDISLSEADFVPGVASAVTSERLRYTKTSGRPRDQNDYRYEQSLRLKCPGGEISEMKGMQQRSIPMVIRKVLPPGPKKSIRKTELVSFESMVFELKRAREKKEKGVDRDADTGNKEVKAKAKGDLKGRPNLVDVKNVGTASASEGKDKEAKNRTGGIDGIDKGSQKVTGQDGKSNKYAGLRGNAKLPKRMPLPRWVDEQQTISHLD